MQRILLLLLISLSFSACKEKKSYTPTTLHNAHYTIYPHKINDHFKSLLKQTDRQSVDSLVHQSHRSNPYPWIANFPDLSQVDTLITFLDNAYLHGIAVHQFKTELLKKQLEAIRTLDLSDGKNINERLAEIDFYASKAYIRYYKGLKYGFIDPVETLNRNNVLLDETILPEARSAELKKRNFCDVDYQTLSKKESDQLIQQMGQHCATQLTNIQPQSKEYLLLKNRYLTYYPLKDSILIPIHYSPTTIIKIGDTHPAVPAIAARLVRLNYLSDPVSDNVMTENLMDAINDFRKSQSLDWDNEVGSPTLKALNRSMKEYEQLIRVNLERNRWRPVLERGTKYIIANVANFMLRAYNENQDSVLQMKICVGDFKHKTPLLAGKIGLIELNPNWNVPKSIISKEIAPSFAKDSNYFDRNHMKVYDQKGKVVNPNEVDWINASKKYNVKQDNGAVSALGRIIFRFPNNHSIYLHDTPSKPAFGRQIRAVSHGCVRLEKPLQLAQFLFEVDDEVRVDRIRKSIDLAPISAKGIALNQQGALGTLKDIKLEPAIPLFITYLTAYSSPTGELQFCDDVYQYDKMIASELDRPF